MALVVKETPEQAGFPAVNPEEEHRRRCAATDQGSCSLRSCSNPVVWIIACAYACTGAVRQGIDQWFPRFMQEEHHM